MTLREEKEELVLELYYKKNYRYRDITKELKMSPNQIREIIKKHEEKDEARANKKKMISLSSQAYKLFSDGRTNLEVAIRLDIPQIQVTQFNLEYQRLKGHDDFERLYKLTKGRITPLLELYQEMVIKRGLSYEKVANKVEIALDRLPYMEDLYEQANRAADTLQQRNDYLENRNLSLEEEEQRKITLQSSSCHHINRENLGTGAFTYTSAPERRSMFSYCKEHRKKVIGYENSEIYEMYEGDNDLD